MQDWIIVIMNHFGYSGIMLLIAVENIFPPIPSEVILTFGGFMTTYTNLTPPGVIGAATAGSMAGAAVLYGAGRFVSASRIEGWLDGRLGLILHLKKGDVMKAASWFELKGKGTVFFCRCIPIVRSLISIPAGMSGMNFPAFILLTAAGSLIWNIVLVYLGVLAGDSWDMITGYVDAYAAITLVVLAVLVTGGVLLYARKR